MYTSYLKTGTRFLCTDATAYGIACIVLSDDTHAIVVVLPAYVPAHAYYNSHGQVRITYDNFDASIHEYAYHRTSVHRIVTNARLK